tara:strand:- start:1521 stop:1802 length:282 start_codon:yes stop_codon:yes gene_type:complete
MESQNQPPPPHGFSLSISRILRERREEVGLSQRTLADLVGVTAASICYYETGKRTPSISTLIKIKCALDLPLRDCITIIEVLSNEEKNESMGN